MIARVVLFFRKLQRKNRVLVVTHEGGSWDGDRYIPGTFKSQRKYIWELDSQDSRFIRE